jgi:tRNA threonylcarbamoyladenosine modification (KEOPS) complex Cgi121 subunit
VVVLYRIRLDRENSALLVGFNDIIINNPEEFLNGIKSRFNSLTIQVINANFIAGFKHLKMIIQQSWTAFRLGVAYNKKIEMEIISRISCDSQISRSLKTVGMKKGKIDLVIIAIGDRKSLISFMNFIKKLGPISKMPFQLNANKRDFLMRHHGLSNEQIKATTLNNKLAIILAEKANLLWT